MNPLLILRIAMWFNIVMCVVSGLAMAGDILKGNMVWATINMVLASINEQYAVQAKQRLEWWS